MVESLDSKQCPLSHPTRIGIKDKHRLENWHKVIVQVVMYDSVAERGGENFPLYRAFNDKANATPHLIAMFEDVSV